MFLACLCAMPVRSMLLLAPPGPGRGWGTHWLPGPQGPLLWEMLHRVGFELDDQKSVVFLYRIINETLKEV